MDHGSSQGAHASLQVIATRISGDLTNEELTFSARRPGHVLLQALQFYFHVYTTTYYHWEHR
jgi:hypothetical protein